MVAVAFAESALSQFFGPAENALVPRLVQAGHLTAANSLNSLAPAGLAAVRQAVGGILGSLAGTSVAGPFRPVAQASTCFALFGLVDLAIFNYPRWDTTLWPVIVMFFLIGMRA